MTVCLLYAGYHSFIVDGVFIDKERAKDHVRREAELHGTNPPIWVGDDTVLDLYGHLRFYNLKEVKVN